MLHKATLSAARTTKPLVLVGHELEQLVQAVAGLCISPLPHVDLGQHLVRLLCLVSPGPQALTAPAVFLRHAKPISYPQLIASP